MRAPFTRQPMKPLIVILCACSVGHLCPADMVDTGADLSALPAVPAGYTVSVFAKEPLVRQPCSMAFDARGRLFVGMGPQYRNPTPDTPGDSVCIIEDTDHDGTADTKKISATGLNAIQGLAWRGRDLWIANAPDLTIARDLDGDDVADEYVKVFTDLGNIEHALHGLVWAPDGRLYMTKGNSKGINDPKQPDRIAPQPFRELFGQAAPPGTPAFPKPQTFTAANYKRTYQDPKDDWGVTGGVLRCDDGGANLQIVARGARNPWDMAHDDGFHWLMTDNDQNEGDRVMMPFFGAHFGWNHPWSSSWTGEGHLPTVPLSHAVFEGSGTGIVFGSLGENRGVFFINDWLRKMTFIFKPEWDGSLMKCAGGEWQPFITGGKSLFRPTDIAFGPDGALWCLSWGRGYGAEYKDGAMTSEGRVYRIASKHADADAPFSAGKDASVGELIRAFGSPLPVHRANAQDELVRRGAAVKGDIIAALESGRLTQSQETWSVWALGRIGPDAFFEKALATPGNLRTQSLRILARIEQPLPAKVSALTKDADARTRFEAVQCLWQSQQHAHIPALLDVAASEQDRLTYYSAWRALRDLAGTIALKQWLTDQRPGVRRAAVLALLEDNALTPDEVKPLASDADKETRKLAASWLSITSGNGPRIKVKDKGVDTADLAPIAGDAPKLTPPAATTMIDAVLSALKTADTGRGRLLVLHPAGATCITCHHVEGRGNHFGPELTGIGTRADARHIIQSMLEPSAVITEGFNLHVITTKQGVQSGVLLDESGIAITIGLPTGQRSRIMRADIIGQETLPVSAMPPFGGLLDAQACADITAWLIKGEPPKLKKKEKKKAAVAQMTPVSETPLIKVHGDAAKGFCIEEHKSRLVLKVDGKPFGDFITEHPEVRRPFMIHLRNRAGTQLTRSFPPQGEDPQDHADMHPGLWLAFGGINGTDFWRNEGRVVVEKVTVLPDGSGFETTSRWLGKDGVEICRDTTRITARVNGNAITLRWQTQLSSAAHELVFDGQEEAGLGIRVAAPLCVKGGSGHITNSAGKTDEKECWGQAANWWRYGNDTAAIRVAPAKEGTRSFWGHARDYGALVINPTGTPDAKKKPGGFTVPKGETLNLIFDITLE